MREDSDLWMVPYADLMSTMVILFLALYGFAAMNRSAGYEKAVARMEKEVAVTEEQKRQAAIKEQEAALAAQLDSAVKKTLPEGAAALILTAERIKLSLSSPVLFGPGSDELKEDIKPFLRQMVVALKALPNEVLVEGHTDNTPILSGRYRTNWELSAARAFAVIDHMTRQGLAPARFYAYGYGEHRPVGTNATPEGRAKNRRIEISLLRQQQKATESKQ